MTLVFSFLCYNCFQKDTGSAAQREEIIPLLEEQEEVEDKEEEEIKDHSVPRYKSVYNLQTEQEGEEIHEVSDNEVHQIGRFRVGESQEGYVSQQEVVEVQIENVHEVDKTVESKESPGSSRMAEGFSSGVGSSYGHGQRPVTSVVRMVMGGNSDRPQTRGPGSAYGDRPLTRSSGFGDRPMTRGMGSAMGDRPASRTGMALDRPDTQQTLYGERSMTRQGDGSSRPTTSGRPITARPVSAALKGAPGTASRLLSTASMQRPGSRTGVATGIGFNTPISVVDRPITQQGLSGMKTGARGPQRQVQDKSYFMGLLRTKIADLSSEIGRLRTEIEAMKQEQSTFLTYDKRVKEMAQELTELQGTLGDYNLLVDFVNTDTEQSEIDEETRAMKDTNQEAAEKLDALFTRKQDMEHMMRQLEVEIDEERHMGESLVEAMKPELRNRYLELRNVNSNLMQHLDQLQLELDALENRKAGLEDELSMSKVKQEAVGLYEKLQDLEEKRNEIVTENQKRGTPKEERERLLLQVKEDNAEIATMERQIGEVQEQMKGIQEELHHLDQDLEENQSERSQKYRELRKREETMDQFLATFENSKVEELGRLENLEQANVALLEKLSRNMAHFTHLPNTRDFDVMKSDLAFKEGELEKSKFTEQGLQRESLNLQSNLQKIEALEAKVQKEMVDLKEKHTRMEQEIIEFSDLDSLKVRAEEKRRALVLEKEELEGRKTAINQNLQEILHSVHSLKNHLHENETYTQLNNLEKKWAHLEQTNFTLKEFVAQKKSESNFMLLKNQAMKLVNEYNKTLQEVVQSGSGLM
ncbi:Intraflagellar transport protein 74 [Halocaridina rubra]|uniref:Intraflagellar transport protein 74 n=1 Tax=Halocaridina rubra TaxID=373956 RepID=A0AAN8WNT8_HALRR